MQRGSLLTAISLAAALSTPTAAVAQTTAPPSTAPATSSSPAPGQNGDINAFPVGIAVLVDESGSLGDSGVAAEQTATTTIIRADPSTGSQMAVVGFGGRNGGPNQSPVSMVCRPTPVNSGPDEEYLAGCPQTLHRRSEAEGDDTDFPDALSQGLSLVNSMHGVSAKIIFMLTDGKLDVSRDPAFGPDPTARQQQAQAQLNAELAQARQSQVALWPIGFNDADQGELNGIAAGGWQSNPLCANAPRPSVHLAANPDGVLTSVLEAFAGARCAAVGPAVSRQLAPGQSVQLQITIPEVATDGSIAVHKVSPGVQVQFVDPEGNVVPPLSGSEDGAEFQLSGENSPVEILRVRDPPPGTWTVKLTAPGDVPSENVSAVVIWQGAVQSSVALNPPQPRPGEQATVQLLLRTRKGPLATPSALQGISAGAVLTGSGFPPITVPLSPGSGGQFSGAVTVPGTGTGAFTLEGVVSGTGISTDERPLTGVLDTGSVGVVGQLAQNDGGQVAPGAHIDDVITFQNNTRTAQSVALTLTDVSGAIVRVTPTTGRVDASGNSQVPFRLLVDPKSATGHAQARLVVTSATGTTYIDELITFDVEYPPAWYQKYWWALLVGGVLVVVAAGFALWQRQRRRRDNAVSDLSARLYQDGRFLTSLPAPGGLSDEFRFEVRARDEGRPSLHHVNGANGGQPAVVVRRAGPVTLMVTAPGYGSRQVRPGEQTGVADRLTVAIEDSRPAKPDRTRKPKTHNENGNATSGAAKRGERDPLL